MKILIRGSSISAGVGVKKSYIDILNESPEFKDYRIINNSEPGETTFDAIWTFEEKIFSETPDVLILHYAMDDAYFPVYRSEFKENLVQIVRLAKKSFNPLIVLLTSHPFEDKYEMNTIYIYYRTIREVAIDLQCSMIPVHTYWNGIIDEKDVSLGDFVQSDYRFPNERGHTLYAEVIIKNLTRIIKG